MSKAGGMLKRLTLVLFVLLFFGPEEQRPVSPSWLVGKMHLLPPGSWRAIPTMRTARAMNTGDDSMTMDAQRIGKCEKAQEMIADLGDDAAKALIWMYAQDPPLPKFHDHHTAWGKGALLHELKEDGKAARWLLPLLKERLAWVEQRLKEGTLNDTCFSSSELAAIDGYISVHGSEDDVREAFRVMDVVKASETQVGHELSWMTPEYLKTRWENASYRRNTIQKRLMPYDERARMQVEVKPDVRMQETESIIRKLEGKTEKAHEYLCSLCVTMMAVIGLYWLMFKKRRFHGTYGRRWKAT